MGRASTFLTNAQVISLLLVRKPNFESQDIYLKILEIIGASLQGLEAKNHLGISTKISESFLLILAASYPSASKLEEQVSVD